MADERPIPKQLSAAVSAGDAEMFARLMREHPEAVWEHPDRPGYTYWLFSAVSRGKLPIVELLVAAGADVNAPKAKDSTGAPEEVIDTACDEGYVEVARWLLDRGAKVNHVVRGQTRCFALSGAAGGGHLEVVKLLVERGAAVNAAWAGMTALDHALTYGEEEVANYLRSVGGRTAEELGESSD